MVMMVEGAGSNICSQPYPTSREDFINRGGEGRVS